ncbi:aldose 1-epimerase family protein [Psychromicrobium sp. YIM B11713]|uniref:aldose 1-epimerase family protein n=1 Tax=Psychromicrobium sp. YIM B11713 TaxID=3145233 RepID=UPI00374F1B2F
MSVLPVSGIDIELRSGQYHAVVASVGASLRSLSFADRPLIVSYRAEELRPVYRGAILAPWPNRVIDGRYSFQGNQYQLPLSEPGRGHALHGLVAWQDWDVVLQEAGRTRLETVLVPQEGYPYRLSIAVEYSLTPQGLDVMIETTNISDQTAPYGAGSHPYLVAGEGVVDDWELEFEAAQLQLVTPDRLIPTEIVEIAPGSLFDFASAKSLRGIEIDHAFSGFPADKAPSATVKDRNGDGVRVSWDAKCPWVQIHTADLPDPLKSRRGLAIEPMTCPPDAFNSGLDLIELLPGASDQTSWTISAVVS